MIKQVITIVLGSLLMMNSSFAANGKVWKGQASLTIKQQHLVSFKKAVAKITVPTRKEKGCLFYEGYQLLDENGDETNVFEFHEIWISKEAMLIDHKANSPHMKEFFKEINADSPETFIEEFKVSGKYVNQIR
jgi:quinol monooxygenase YgiN